MNNAEVLRMLALLRGARIASDWHGMFTQEIREATKTHRLKNIATPIDEAIAMLQAKLKDKGPMRKRIRKAYTKPNVRLPYKDD